MTDSFRGWPTQRFLAAILAAGGAIVLIEPRVFPGLQFDSIPLVQSRFLLGVGMAAVLLLPFAVAWWLLARGRTASTKQLGRGLAIAAGSLAVPVLLLASLATLALAGYSALWGESPGWLVFLRFGSGVGLALLSAGAAWSAIRDDNPWPGRTAGIASAAVLMYAMGARMLFGGAYRLTEQRARAYRERMMNDSRAAESAVRTLAACVIAYRGAEQRPLPSGLHDVVRVTGCEEPAASEYQLDFRRPAETDPQSAAHDGCLFVAEFVGSSLPIDHGGQFQDGKTLMSDCAGMVYEQERHGGGPRLNAGRAPEILSLLAWDLAEFAHSSNDGSFPAALRRLSDMKTSGVANMYRVAGRAADELDSNIVTVSPYAIRYMPSRSPAGGAILSYEIEARCTAYPSQCLRSYFVDTAGRIHGSGQNRTPSAGDPVVQACEDGGLVVACDGSVARPLGRR